MSVFVFFSCYKGRKAKTHTLLVPAQAAATMIISSALWSFVGDEVTNLLVTWVQADVYHHEIQGVSTTDPNTTNIGYLNGDTVYVSDGSGYDGMQRVGYTPYLWGTGTLGSQMFYKVYGVEYTPTSWSNMGY